MPAAVAVRPLTLGDYAALRDLDDAVMRHSAPAFLGFDWDAATDERRETMRAITPDAFAFYATTGCTLVGECGDGDDNGVIAGYVLAQPLRHFDLEPLAVWVEDISVHPAYHRRGVATALYRRLHDTARSMGATIILAGIHPGNAPSLALHRRVGFAVHNTKTAAWYVE